MACNCATAEQIDALYKKYGEKQGDDDASFIQKVGGFFRKTGVYFCVALLFPAILLYVLYKAFGSENHKIDVTKFFNFKHKAIGANVG